jgi:hypothetical protein
MKATSLFINLGFIFLCLLISGCERSEIEKQISWEISPTTSSIILDEDNGIEFKFYLLNEQGKTATVFNEGENFTFYFSVTNTRNEKLFFDPGFAYSKENDFCKVYTSDNQVIGKPYMFRGNDKVGAAAYPFDINKEYVFEQLWTGNLDTAWRWEYGYYTNTFQTLLPKGNYYTGFKYRFQFPSSVNSTLYTNMLNFKINFQIQ